MNVVVSKAEMAKITSALLKRSDAASSPAVKYLDLGVSTVRLLCYTPDVIPLMQKQLGYVLRDEAEKYDGTIVVWKDFDMDAFLNAVFSGLTFQYAMRLRVEMLCMKGKYPLYISFYEGSTEGNKIGWADYDERQLELYDAGTKTAFFNCQSYEPEDFVKNGHMFVKQINRIIKSDTVNLTHGAVFGYAGNGFLLCGRGKRGKSTLTVESMLQGFEYVSDDYQILEKAQNGLFAYPIYSIVTLSYRMYNEMYDRFPGKFVSNNFAQDKYLFNIASLHGQFRTQYPIRFCLFPEIVADEHPSIVPCTSEEKGRAAIHLLHSTLLQMNDLGEADTVSKLLHMIWDKPFVKFNLCNNISENTEYLRQYLASSPQLSPDTAEAPEMLLDITYDLVTVLDTRSYRFTELNKFASNIFMMRLCGVEASVIRDALAGFEEHNPDILSEFDKFEELSGARNYYSFGNAQCTAKELNPLFAEECEYKLSVIETVGSTTLELISNIQE